MNRLGLNERMITATLLLQQLSPPHHRPVGRETMQRRGVTRQVERGRDAQVHLTAVGGGGVFGGGTDSFSFHKTKTCRRTRSSGNARS